MLSGRDLDTSLDASLDTPFVGALTQFWLWVPIRHKKSPRRLNRGLELLDVCPIQGPGTPALQCSLSRASTTAKPGVAAPRQGAMRGYIYGLQGLGRSGRT